MDLRVYVDDDFYPKTIDFPILMDEYEIDNFYITSVAFIFLDVYEWRN